MFLNFQKIIRGLLMALMLLSATFVLAQAKGSTLRVEVSDKADQEPIVMAVVQLQPGGMTAVTDVNGRAELQRVPKGVYTLHINYVGYESVRTQLRVDGELNLKYKMQQQTLALKEVSVTARQRTSGASTSSVIGRQALDHLQAVSLADVMQLLPGQKMGNTDFTQQSNLQLRSLVNNNTNAFGSSIIVDGMPMSNNGAMTQGGFSSTAFVGTDLRQISADDIQEVEVVRGIPSAEYGDLSSGLVMVHSKVGVTPWQVKGKVTPELQNYSLSKGFNLQQAGVLNFSADYAKAWGDPRQKTRSFGRWGGSVGYGKDINRKWHTDTKLRFLYAQDWSGNDPDAKADGTETKSTTMNFQLTHNGRVQLGHPLARSLRYTLGVKYGQSESYQDTWVANSTGFLPILTAMQTGYYAVPWQTTAYRAQGTTQSRPGNVFAKLTDSFFFRHGKTQQSFKLGVEYNYDWNSGRGFYNANDSLPLKPNNSGRPRAFSDVPGLHQFSAFAEDNFTWQIDRVRRLNVNFGLRFTSLQPFSEVSTMALSPRLNVMLSLTKWLDVRGGIGLNSKSPGLDYLYPDKKYDDREVANYLPQTNTAGQLVYYHTQVYDVQKSKDLKNATTTKIEAGVDVKLPGRRQLSLVAYRDRTPNGFAASTEYFTYTYNYYNQAQGLLINPTGPTTIDWANPVYQYLAFMTTGAIGNTNTSVNRGVEADFNLGELPHLNTRLYLSGAWSETKTWSTDMNSESPRASILPAVYSVSGTTPFKVVYPSGQDFSRYRRLLTTLRVVTNIPRLRMVASLTAQAIWHSSSWSYTADKDPIGWIDTDLQYHTLMPEQMSGYLGMDAQYYAEAPVGQQSVKIADLQKRYSDSRPSKQPITWNLQARLTKELGRIGSLSFYANNALFYEPFLTGNLSGTLTQRNTGTFSFGAELSFNL